MKERVYMENRELIDMYRTMLTIRRFEERVSREFSDGNIRGYVHTYIGEEAVATGVCANLLRTDSIVSHHRGHGHCIAKGAGGVDRRTACVKRTAVAARRSRSAPF